MKKLILILALTFTPFAHSEQITFGFLGATVHGTRVDASMADQMPRKIMSNGVAVWHPEFNLSYKDKGWLYNVTLLSDCFANPAVFFGMGPSWDLFNDWLTVSLPVGMYIRKSPKDGLKYPEWIRHGGTDTIPIAWVSLQSDFSIVGKLKWSVQVASNYILTHGFIGLTWKFKEN